MSIGIVLALFAALGYGTADFVGGAFVIAYDSDVLRIHDQANTWIVAHVLAHDTHRIVR